jgi:hypothetical protein
MLLKDGIGTLNIDELMLMLRSHKKVWECSLYFCQLSYSGDKEI